MMLTKEQILQMQDRSTTEVDVWGGTVKLCALSLADQIEFAKTQDKDDLQKILKLVQMSCVDENNKCMFSDDDMNTLAEKSWDNLKKIFDAACILNKMGAGVIEAEAKNS